MGEFDLNLSTRPFPAYRITNLLLTGVLVIVIVITVWQIYGFVQYSSLAGDIRDSERNTRVEAEALGRQLAELESQLNRPESAAKLTEVDFLNKLIARRRFSWTHVFATLEDLVPDTVHLLSLRPEVALNGPVLMHIDVRGRSIDSLSNFIDALERSPDFENVIVSVEQKMESTSLTDVDVSLTVNYFPEGENQ